MPERQSTFCGRRVSPRRLWKVAGAPWQRSHQAVKRRKPQRQVIKIKGGAWRPCRRWPTERATKINYPSGNSRGTGPVWLRLCQRALAGAGPPPPGSIKSVKKRTPVRVPSFLLKMRGRPRLEAQGRGIGFHPHLRATSEQPRSVPVAGCPGQCLGGRTAAAVLPRQRKNSNHWLFSETFLHIQGGGRNGLPPAKNDQVEGLQARVPPTGNSTMGLRLGEF